MAVPKPYPVVQVKKVPVAVPVKVPKPILIDRPGRYQLYFNHNGVFFQTILSNFIYSVYRLLTVLSNVMVPSIDKKKNTRPSNLQILPGHYIFTKNIVNLPNAIHFILNKI